MNYVKINFRLSKLIKKVNLTRQDIKTKVPMIAADEKILEAKDSTKQEAGLEEKKVLRRKRTVTMESATIFSKNGLKNK